MRACQLQTHQSDSHTNKVTKIAGTPFYLQHRAIPQARDRSIHDARIASHRSIASHAAAPFWET
jgi:hypothetical protein